MGRSTVEQLVTRRRVNSRDVVGLASSLVTLFTPEFPAPSDMMALAFMRLNAEVDSRPGTGQPAAACLTLVCKVPD